MPSAQHVPQKPERVQTLSQTETRGSWGLILVGIILLILGLLMFLYVKGYRPGQKEFIYQGSIKWTGSMAQAERPPRTFKSSVSASLSPEPRESREKREPKSARPILNHSQHATGQRASNFNHTQTQSAPSEPSQRATPAPQTSPAAPTPTPERLNQPEKPNALRRFFKWLAGLFKSKKQASKALPNSPPVISAVTLSETTLVLKPDCAEGMLSEEDCALQGNQVQVRVAATDADGDELRYKPIAQVGKLSGDKETITWDLSGVSPGTHTLKVSASDGKAESRLYPVTLSVRRCECKTIYIVKSPCPYPVSVSAPASVRDGDVATFSSDVAYNGTQALNYSWTVTPASARIIGGAGTPVITVDTTGLGSQRIAATLIVDDGSGESACRQRAQAVISVLSSAIVNARAKLLGRIVDSKGSPIRGATVSIVGEDGQVRSVRSDAEGRYAFDNLPVGTYSVQVTHPNFRGGSWSVPLTAGTNQTFQFPLEPGNGSGGNDPRPSPTPTPTASPTPSPSPSVSPTLTPSPTPDSKGRKQDEIRVFYPERFLQDTESEVTFELEQVNRQVITTTTNVNTNVSVVSKPAAIPGVAVGTPLAEAFAGYEAFATVRLIPTGLLVTSTPAELEQPLNDKLAKWVWRLKPEEKDGADVSFRFEVSVVWRAKDRKLPDKNIQNVWPHESFTVPTGPPLTVKAAVYTAPVSFGGGLVALGLGVLQKRRRRLLGEEDVEEEIPTAPMPEPPQETMAATEEPEDEVSSTVYAPTEAPPGDSFLVQVFLHLPEQATDLEELAREADDAARARITSKLKKTIKRGTELKFHLTMPGLEIDEPSQSCVWEGEPVCAQFGVTIPQDRKPGNIIATVIVSEASIPIGHLKFKFKIAGSASQDAAVPANQPVAAGNLTRYKQAFISYASPDRAEVLKRVQMLNLVKVKFFQDLLTLEPGDNWEQLLYKYIDESDVFYLFWSQAASKSEWVKKEIVYALKRKAGNEESAPEIVPVIIEGPPAVKPPEDLAFLQFNDKFMYFIQAEEHDN